MTTEEKFISRLKRLIRAMPPTLELIVRHGSIDVCATGDRKKYFDAVGHTDMVPTIENISTNKVSIIPGGESL